MGVRKHNSHDVEHHLSDPDPITAIRNCYLAQLERGVRPSAKVSAVKYNATLLWLSMLTRPASRKPVPPCLIAL